MRCIILGMTLEEAVFAEVSRLQGQAWTERQRMDPIFERMSVLVSVLSQAGIDTTKIRIEWRCNYLIFHERVGRARYRDLDPFSSGQARTPFRPDFAGNPRQPERRPARPS